MMFFKKKKPKTSSVICLSQKSLTAVLLKLQSDESQEFQVIFKVEAWVATGKLAGFFVQVPEELSADLQTIALESDRPRIVG